MDGVGHGDTYVLAVSKWMYIPLAIKQMLSNEGMSELQALIKSVLDLRHIRFEIHVRKTSEGFLRICHILTVVCSHTTGADSHFCYWFTTFQTSCDVKSRDRKWETEEMDFLLFSWWSKAVEKNTFSHQRLKRNYSNNRITVETLRIADFLKSYSIEYAQHAGWYWDMGFFCMFQCMEYRGLVIIDQIYICIFKLLSESVYSLKHTFGYIWKSSFTYLCRFVFVVFNITG